MTIDWSLIAWSGVILALLACSGLFSGSETALTAASRARMHKLAADGSKSAVRVNRLIEDKERLIGAILLGNNLVNILASSLATSLLLTYLGEAAVAVATLGMTALVLILAEVLPKTYAIANAERSAMRVAPLIRIIVFLFAPIVTTVQFIVRGLLRMFGIDIDASQNVLSAHEEIRGAIDLHHQAGDVIKSDRDMLGGILDLAELEVSEVMVHRKNMETLDIDLPTEQIVDLALKTPHTRIPLWKDEPDDICRGPARKGPFARDRSQRRQYCRSRHSRDYSPALVRSGYDTGAGTTKRLFAPSIALRARRGRIWRLDGAGHPRRHFGGNRW